MSFKLRLGNFTNQKNAVKKELLLTNNNTWPFTQDGVLKDGSSIVDPVILVEASMTDVHNYNYAYIHTFGRFYFITDIVSIRSYLIEIHLHCDVLTSFRDEYKEISGIVERREVKPNTKINDGSFKVYQDRYVINLPFSGSFTDFEYILALAGS